MYTCTQLLTNYKGLSTCIRVHCTREAARDEAIIILHAAEAPGMLNICLPIIPDYARSAKLLIILETMPAY